jgi:hypothetical protein
VGEIVNKAGYPNHVWSYDFVEDRTERGGKLRILAIIDEYTRECLGHQGCAVNTGLGGNRDFGVVVPDAWGAEVHPQ